ncbi:uncharacterized protein LOC128960577 isoform X2 [Oppia nitens]|uniref:uncharacterized protein LOC128960577 isoform X2 n=1 Tax=Oppia nitens TaxID=1686743 RepID=UPI0023DBE9DD|nr:uncharacterized protein LOC128960577 isoform X2 [Oppia nitens]
MAAIDEPLYCVNVAELDQPINGTMSHNCEERPKKYEVIICENTPEELPPDVVRSNSKVEEQYYNLAKDLANIRNKFESGVDRTGLDDNHNNQNNKTIDKNILQRSDSISVRMQKYQSAVAGDKDSHYSSDEENTDPKEIQPEPEKLVAVDLSSLKSQWETGSISANKDESDATKDELEELRKKLSLGRSESLKEVYERTIKESHNSENGGHRSEIVLDSPIKANSIKEKFEKGLVDSESERIDKLKNEREEEFHTISESDSNVKEARSMFKQIDATATKGPTPPQVNGQSHNTNGLSKKLTNGDVIRSGEQVGEDVTIDSNQLQERFAYFENLPKEVPKETKRHQITPPKDVNVIYENNVTETNPDIIRSLDTIDDIPKVETTKKMLDKFKELEKQVDNNQISAPKPLKRITPPKDFVPNTNGDKEPSPERDPNIIKSSLKNEDNIPVTPEITRNLKAKFENWSVDKQNRKNSSFDAEDEFVPHIDTTKNLRAKFEAIKDDDKSIEKPKPRVNRFVFETTDPIADLCYVCRSKLYAMEKMEFSGIRLHKNCFRCFKCKCNLRLDNFTITGEKLYCIPHFKQLFMEKGNYEQGFGLEQHKDKWMNKCINNNDLIINNDDTTDNNDNEHTVDDTTHSHNQLICDVNANEAHIDYANLSVSDVSDNEY